MKVRGLLLGLGLALNASAWAQAPAPYQPPRAPDGHVDLTGLWLNPDGLIPLETNPAFGAALAVSPTQARTIADAVVVAAQKRLPLQLDYPDHADLTFVRGEGRTRLVIEPPDGKLPYLPWAQKAVDDWFVRYLRGRGGLADNPEELAHQDRCVAWTGVPPMMYAATYGSQRQIIQTRDHIIIFSEMADELRIVRMGGAFQPAAVRTLWGDSVGHWEGDALVVETVNFRLDEPFHAPAQQKPILIGPNSKVVERFTRVSDDELDYAFTVEDPTIYARPWLGEYAMSRSNGPLLEFACSEGNDAVPLMLNGARADGRKATEKQKQ